MFPFRRWHFRLSRQPDIEILEHEIRVGKRMLKPDLYRRKGPNSQLRPALIIFVPLAKEGKRDKLVTNFMEGMARLGYIVMVPFWPNRPIGTIATTDTTDLIASLQWLKSQPGVDPNRIGIVAVSYGVGPALLAASQPPIGSQIQFIAAIGGYADLKNVTRFAICGRFNYGSIHGQLPPDPYLVQIMTNSAKRWRQTKTLNNLFSAQTPKLFDQAFANLAKPIRRWFRELSPVTVANRVRTPLLILHSTNDTLVPYTESLRLYDAVKDHTQASLDIVDVFEHTVPIPATPINLFRIYLPNLWRIVRYIYRILAFQEQ